MNIFGFISKIFQPAADLIDNLHTSEEEKLTIKAVLLELQGAIIGRVLDLEKSKLEAQSSIIIAEAKSDGWLTKSWRPITMLTLVATVVAYWMGWGGQDIPLEIVNRMFSLVQLGVGGYVGGRSVEKIVPIIMSALKSKEK